MRRLDKFEYFLRRFDMYFVYIWNYVFALAVVNWNIDKNMQLLSPCFLTNYNFL